MGLAPTYEYDSFTHDVYNAAVNDTVNCTDYQTVFVTHDKYILHLYPDKVIAICRSCARGFISINKLYAYIKVASYTSITKDASTLLIEALLAVPIKDIIPVIILTCSDTNRPAPG